MPGLILKEDIEKVRAAADLYDIVSADVALKASGTGTFMGLCPFHDEKTPSFSVRPSLGAWHCFGCGLGGDVFKYVEQSENVGFADAVEILADKYHIELHYDSNQPQQRRGSSRSRLLEATEEAQKFFVSQIMSKEALAARKLLDGRNFSQSDCERFGCGYAPQGWDNLVRHLSSKGFTHQEMLDAGLARQGRQGVYDYFRGRVTWPIRDATGRTLGFGARKLFEDDTIQAKYINTPDTQLYHKNQVLYGLDLAKANIVKKRQVTIVEGYTDVMACHLAGVDTAVATCGTAFGAEHAKIVRRLISDDKLGAIQLIGPGKNRTSRVTFTFDGDAAGQKAALHAFGLDGAFLSQTFVAVADDNLDPCDLRIKRGDAAVRTLVEQASPLYDFVINAAINQFDTQYTTGQVGAMKAVVPIIAQIRDRSLLDAYTRKTARRIGLELEVMNREVQSTRRRMRVRDEDSYAPKTNRYADERDRERMQRQEMMNPAGRRRIQRQDAVNQGYYRVDDAVFICEQQLMGMLIQIPRAVDPTMFKQLNEDSFMIPVFRSLYQAVEASGGLPSNDTPQGLWLHNLSKAAGPMLQPVVDELAVMPMPLPSNGKEQGAANDMDERSGAGDPLRPPTEAETQYTAELLARLIDMGFMRQIAATRRRMTQLPEGQEKLDMLGRITALEERRKNLQAEVFGNTAG